MVIQVLYECQEAGTANFKPSGTVDWIDNKHTGFCDCCGGAYTLVERALGLTLGSKPIMVLRLPWHERTVNRDMTLEAWRAQAIPGTTRIEPTLPQLAGAARLA